MALLKVIGTWLLLCDSYVLNDFIPDQWLNAICFPLDMRIQQANSTAYHSAMQTSDSLEKLKLVTFVREKVESDLGDAFQTLYRNNSLRLEEISKINEILQALVKEAEIIGEQANGNLTMGLRWVRALGTSSSSDILCSVNIGCGFHGVSLSICHGLEYSEKLLLASFLVSEGSLGWFGECVWKECLVKHENII